MSTEIISNIMQQLTLKDYFMIVMGLIIPLVILPCLRWVSTSLLNLILKLSNTYKSKFNDAINKASTNITIQSQLAFESQRLLIFSLTFLILGFLFFIILINVGGNQEKMPTDSISIMYFAFYSMIVLFAGSVYLYFCSIWKYEILNRVWAKQQK